MALIFLLNNCRDIYNFYDFSVVFKLNFQNSIQIQDFILLWLGNLFLNAFWWIFPHSKHLLNNFPTIKRQKGLIIYSISLLDQFAFNMEYVNRMSKMFTEKSCHFWQLVKDNNLDLENVSGVWYHLDNKTFDGITVNICVVIAISALIYGHIIYEFFFYYKICCLLWTNI